MRCAIVVRDYAVETLAEPDAVLVVDETGFLKQGKASCGVGAPIHRLGRQDHQLPDSGCSWPMSQAGDMSSYPRTKHLSSACALCA